MEKHNNTDVLHENEKYDTLKNNKALLALKEILERKNTAEVFIGKYGIVIREISRKTKYTQD